MAKNNEVYKYRWVLLFCALVTNAFTWGYLLSVGVYYVRWLDHFQASKAEVAIVGALASGSACAFGPVFSIFINRFGVRVVGIAGGILMVFGGVASSFASNLAWLGLLYGIVIGVGAGSSYLAISVAVNQYFIKQRSLAEGIMSTGVGLGTFACTIFNQLLLDTYDWKGALLIMGGVSAHVIVLSQLTIPPSYLEKFPKLVEWKSRCEPTFEEEKQENESIQIDERQSDLECLGVDYEIKRKDIEINGGSWSAQSLVLFRNPVFIMLLLSDFFAWLCIYVPYVHLAERSRLAGMDSDTTAWISSTIGLSGVIGRPFMSAIPSILKLNVFYIYGFSNFILGVVTVLSPFFSNKIGLFAYAAVFGFLCVNVPLLKASAADLLGIDAFATAYGWLLMVESVGIYIGTPFAGAGCMTSLIPTTPPFTAWELALSFADPRWRCEM